MSGATILRAGHGARECGHHRKKGAVYAEHGLGDHGAPLEDFLVDYPIVIPPSLGLPVQGVKLVERDGTWHVLDRIGETYYPDPTVFIEEVRALGVSRRLPGGTDFSKLGPDSQLLLVHDKGWLNEWEAFRCGPCGGTGGVHGGARNCATCAMNGGWTCPKGIPAHRADTAEACCAGVWYENCLWWPKGSRTGDMARWEAGDTTVSVALACGRHYPARRRPYGRTVSYSAAIIAAFPIHCLAVVAGNAAETAKAQHAALHAGLPVLLDTA